MKNKKIARNLFLCSLSSFILTLILEFSQRYNQILFILRHSTLYLGIAFMICAVVAFFYSLYKSIFTKRQINLIYLNIPTLIIILVSLIWVADTRLDFIAENEVPHYINEVLYDENSNKIYESILIGVDPLVELVSKTDSKLEIHIEETCECLQNSYYIEEIYPDINLDRKVDGVVEIFVDITIIYNDDNSMESYTIEETRIVTFNPDGLSIQYGHVSRKLEVLYEYSNNSLSITHSSNYYAEVMTEQEYSDSPIVEHYDFTNDQATQTIYRLYKTLDENDTEVYIMDVKEEDEDINELSILNRIETDSGEITISFIESPNKNVPEFVWSIQSMKSNLIGNYIINDNQIIYEQSYDEANVEHGLGHHSLLKVFDYDTSKFTLSTNSHIMNSANHTDRDINKYKDLFSSSSFVEIVNRSGGTITERLSRSENLFEIDNILLFQIDEKDFGKAVSYYIDASPFNPYNRYENSNIMMPLDLEHEPPITGYFNFASMLFQNTYEPTIIYENNEMINFIIND